MKLLKLFQRLDELRVRYKSPGEHDRYEVVAHRGNVWMIGDNDKNTEKVVLDIHGQTGLLSPDDDIDDINQRMEERPDVIVTTYDPSTNALWMGRDLEIGHHPRASLELKKLANLLNVDYVQGSRVVGSDDQEVQHWQHEMEGQVPDELYHGTDVNALRDIMRLGLVPGRGEGNWSEVGQFDMIFLAADWHKAAFHALRQGNELNQGAPIILKVKIPDRTKIEPDFDAMVSLSVQDEEEDEYDERADRLGYSGAGGYQQSWNVKSRQDISDYNPGGTNLPFISGVIAYSGRIPPSHILRVDVDLRGELGDTENLDFTPFRMPQEAEELQRALELFQKYEYWYPGMEDELEDDEDDEEDEWNEDIQEDDAEHQAALNDTGFWGRAGAGVLFQARDTGRILFAHRSDEVEEPHTWGTWGGAIDEGEDPAIAASREAQEEAGFNPSRGDIIPMYVFKHPSGFQYFNFLVLTDTEFQPHLNWESQGFEWVEFGNWPQPLHPGAASLLSDQRSLAIMKKNAR